MTEIGVFFHAIQVSLSLSMYSIPAAAWAKCKTGEIQDTAIFFIYMTGNQSLAITRPHLSRLTKHFVTPEECEEKVKEFPNLGERDEFSLILELRQGPSRGVRTLPSLSQL